MKRYFIGIDQGTTGSTALLIDEKWDVVAAKNVEHMQIYPNPDGWSMTRWKYGMQSRQRLRLC